MRKRPFGKNIIAPDCQAAVRIMPSPYKNGFLPHDMDKQNFHVRKNFFRPEEKIIGDGLVGAFP